MSDRPLLLRISIIELSGKTSKNKTVHTSTLSTKGQLVIPGAFRKALQLKPGDKVSFTLLDDKLVISRVATPKARLTTGNRGRPVLVAEEGAPAMTPELVKKIMEESR